MIPVARSATALLLSSLVILSGPAAAAPPAPPPRPAEFGTAAPALADAPVPDTVKPPAAVGPSSCLDALRAQDVQFEPAAQPGGRDAACAVADPVRLASLADRRGGRIDLPDRPVVSCALASPLTDWMVAVAAPVLSAARGSALRSVHTGPGFECRGRNRQPGAKLSAHGSGLALDIASFTFTDGTVAMVRDPGPAVAPAVAAIRRAGCGWFTTVLGPGSDPFHADHLHVDVQLHGSSDRYRICQ